MDGTPSLRNSDCWLTFGWDDWDTNGWLRVVMFLLRLLGPGVVVGGGQGCQVCWPMDEAVEDMEGCVCLPGC